MNNSQQVKDLMLLEIGDSIDRALNAMKSMHTFDMLPTLVEELRQARDRAEAEVELLQTSIKELEEANEKLAVDNYNLERDLKFKLHKPQKSNT